MGERPAKGILMVAISQRMSAKLYMSAALLSMSSGLCCRAGKTEGNNEPYATGLHCILAVYITYVFNIQKTIIRAAFGRGALSPLGDV